VFTIFCPSVPVLTVAVIESVITPAPFKVPTFQTPVTPLYVPVEALDDANVRPAGRRSLMVTETGEVSAGAPTSSITTLSPTLRWHWLNDLSHWITRWQLRTCPHERSPGRSYRGHQAPRRKDGARDNDRKSAILNNLCRLLRRLSPTLEKRLDVLYIYLLLIFFDSFNEIKV